MTKNISLVIPTIPLDINNFLSCSDLFFSNLPINNIYLICDISSVSLSSDNPRIILIDESKVIKYPIIKDLLISRIEDSEIENRTGWYLQQFLKMEYARLCEDEYYLLWDSDTIPLKPIQLFDKNGKPYLDYKTEYNKPYFDTILRILPGYSKEFKGSFIAEHMLIKTSYMRELLDAIEANNTISGKYFYEKIINSISIKDIFYSGFSEFETYGTFVHKRYPNKYIYRKWKSLRYGGLFYHSTDLKKSYVIKWLSSYYDSISFEKGHYISHFHIIPSCKSIRHIFHPYVLDLLSIPIRIKRRLCKNL